MPGLCKTLSTGGSWQNATCALMGYTQQAGGGTQKGMLANPEESWGLPGKGDMTVKSTWS